ncbi:MAG TPA: ferrous iron transport protein A [Clostridia bacterium]|nr:ferrous iron transport protein A [Clostridia bacterium]
MSILPLASLPVGREATVRYVSPDAPSYRRILDLGLVGGTKVKVIRSSPFGDPRAYLVRGAVVALRREDAQAIMVEVTDE